MFNALLCRITGCRFNPTIYSASIAAEQGADSPEPIPEINGWTVWKQGQTEIYEIRHNLGLGNPDRQMHVVATPMNLNTILTIESVESNHFRISAWQPENLPSASAFMFIAVRYG